MLIRLRGGMNVRRNECSSLCVYGMGSVQYIVQRQMDNRSMARVHQEVAFLKSSSLFTLHCKPNHLLDFYYCLPAQDRPDLRRLAARIEREMTASASKCVYVALKWLGFQHTLLQESNSPAEVERTVETLSKFPTVTALGNFEEYISAHLLTPYRQYLLKLAAIQLTKAAEDYSPRQEGEGEGEGGVYCMYNLISYSLQAFAGAIAQFSRYFQRFFPCLNEYVGRVGKDLRRFMRRIQSGYERGQMPSLHFLELEQLEGSLGLFDRTAQQFTNNWMLPQTNAQSFEFQNGDGMERNDSALQTIPISNNKG